MRLQTILYFISFYATVFCCNPNWFPYGEKCYRGIEFDYDVRLARRYCQIFRGDLALINDNSTLQNIAPILFENSQEVSYWVHENSTYGGTTSSSSCNYIYSDESNSYLAKFRTDGRCDDHKQFVCEVPKIDGELTCPTSWSNYGNICYKTFKNLATYEQAISYCSLQRSKLAVLDHIVKEHNAAAVIIGLKEVFLVAAKTEDTNETMEFKWSSGSTFKPSCQECVTKSESPGGCIGFSSDQHHPTMFTWISLNCSASNYYMCEMQPKLISTTQPPTEPTTTIAPLHCPVGYNWKAHLESGFCYWETTYESERLSWYQARKFCQAYGGDLATYDNEQQEEHGLGGAKGHYRGLWFGLKRGKDDIMRWVDNVTRTYTNWMFSEPDLESSSKFCAMHGSSNSQWELDYCGVRRWFICKAPQTRMPMLPELDMFKKVSCNFSGPSLYSNQWYLFEDHCYLVRDEAKYSWDTAKNFCQDNDGRLASIHSFEETDFVMQLLPASPTTDLWIGLSARGLDSSLTWSDGTPLQFLYWEDKFNITRSVEKCIYFNKLKGSWKSDHCNKFYGVVCKRGLNASVDLSTPEPTPLMPGNCEEGWYRLGNKCYKSFGEKWSRRESWTGANEKCGTVDATLASIHSAEEQDFLTDLMLINGVSMWIGLQNIDKGTLFKWSDDSPLDFTEWAANEPMLTEEDNEFGLRVYSTAQLCVKLDYDTTAMGKWGDTLCYSNHGFFCQKFINQSLSGTSADPFTCTHNPGWHRLGNSCFGVFEENTEDKLPWIQAQSKCREHDGNLITFSSSAVILFLQKRIKKSTEFFWIGVRETSQNKYESMTRRKTTFTNWLIGQPQQISEVDNCVAMDAKGKWAVRNCQEKLSFICEWTLEVAEDIPSVVSNNPCFSTDWEDIGDFCYYFSSKYVVWNTALQNCHHKGGQLASFHSEAEVYQVKRALMKRENELATLFHIGLGKRSDGTYAWVDQSPVDFVNWEDDRVPGVLDLDCVAFNRFSGKWIPLSCINRPHPFICSYSKLKHGIKKSDLKNSSQKIEPEQYGETVVGGLSAGGIVGLVFSVLIISVVVGGIIYHFYPSRKPSPILLEPDNL